MNQLIQVRLPKQQVEYIDQQVKDGIYATRSEAIRGSILAQITNNIVNFRTTPKGDSVERVRAVRKEISEKLKKMTPTEITNYFNSEFTSSG